VTGQTTPDEAVAAGPPASGNRRTPSRIILGVAVVGMAIVMIVGALAHARLTGVDGRLTSTRVELQQIQHRLSSDRARLGVATGQATAVEHSLASDAALLGLDQTQLANAATRTDVQSASVSQLHTCLSGVERALNQFALDDRSGAVATLNTVASSCQAAKPAGS